MLYIIIIVIIFYMQPGHSFAVKKLPKKSKSTIQLASDLIKLMENLLELDNDNILPYTHCIEYPEELWLATPICDYNLETYIDLMRKKPNSYSLNLQNTVKQVEQLGKISVKKKNSLHTNFSKYKHLRAYTVIRTLLLR